MLIQTNANRNSRFSYPFFHREDGSAASLICLFHGSIA